MDLPEDNGIAPYTEELEVSLPHSSISLAESLSRTSGVQTHPQLLPFAHANHIPLIVLGAELLLDSSVGDCYILSAGNPCPLVVELGMQFRRLFHFTVSSMASTSTLGPWPSLPSSKTMFDEGYGELLLLGVRDGLRDKKDQKRSTPCEDKGRRICLEKKRANRGRE